MDEAINNKVAEFPKEEGQEEIDAAAKVAHLSKIAVDLKKQVEDIKAQQRLSMPLEVLEVHQKKTSEVVDRIKREKLCKEAIDQVSTT